MNFSPPGPADRLRAIGPTEGLPTILHRAFTPGSDFEPLPAPRPGDWLAEHNESGQTYDEFIRSKPNKPDKVRHKIYLQPLGEFPAGQSPFVETLKRFAADYFAMEVDVLQPLSVNGASITTRINPHTRNRQILATDVLAFLKRRLPPDAFCVMAVTMEDLYPGPSWDFVFGQANLRDRVGVFSFARYDPTFYGGQRERDYKKTLLMRSCKVLAHEMAHTFSLHHCIFFKCVLNGSNSLTESDARPMSLCPVCLRKLEESIGFDVVDRYRRLLAFYREVGFVEDARWVERRLKRISS